MTKADRSSGDGDRHRGPRLRRSPGKVRSPELIDMACRRGSRSHPVALAAYAEGIRRNHGCYRLRVRPRDHHGIPVYGVRPALPGRIKARNHAVATTPEPDAARRTTRRRVLWIASRLTSRACTARPQAAGR